MEKRYISDERNSYERYHAWMYNLAQTTPTPPKVLRRRRPTYVSSHRETVSYKYVSYINFFEQSCPKNYSKILFEQSVNGFKSVLNRKTYYIMFFELELPKKIFQNKSSHTLFMCFKLKLSNQDLEKPVLKLYSYSLDSQCSPQFLKPRVSLLGSVC